MAFSKLGTSKVLLDLSPSPERPASMVLGLRSKSPGQGETGRTRLRGGSDSCFIDGALDERPAAKRSKHGQEDVSGRNRSRALVRDKLAAAFASSDAGVDIAAAIEEALHSQLGDGKEYSAQARAILFNLKDFGEGSLRQKLLGGRCDPTHLPKMTADELLNDAKSSERALAQRKAAEAATLKADALQETDMFTCESCSSTKTAYSQTAELRTYGAQQKMVSVSHVTCLSCGNSWITR